MRFTRVKLFERNLRKGKDEYSIVRKRLDSGESLFTLGLFAGPTKKYSSLDTPQTLGDKIEALSISGEHIEELLLKWRT